jgi:hypothetical protein
MCGGCTIGEDARGTMRSSRRSALCGCRPREATKEKMAPERSGVNGKCDASRGKRRKDDKRKREKTSYSEQQKGN